MTKEEKKQRTYEVVQSLTLMADDFMKFVFDDNKVCCSLLVNTILGREDIIIETCETESSVNNLYGKSVSLDIFATDTTGKKYDIEIQQQKKGANPKRARYYSSLLDTNISLKGEDYSDLPETYIVFIMENDIFGENLPIYEIDRTIKQTGKPFGDETHIIYVNSQIKDENTALGRLMHDFHCADPDKMFNKLLAKATRQAKQKEGIGTMCEAVEKLINEGKEEGRAEERKKIAMEMISAEKRYPLHDIAKITKFSVLEILDMAKKMGKITEEQYKKLKDKYTKEQQANS